MGIDENEVARVRRMVSESRGRGRRRAYAPETKRAAVSLVRRAKQAGTSVAALAHRLGVHPVTLGEWVRRLGDEPEAAFALARVVEAPAVVQGRVVHPASGLCVEGLTVAQMAELLARLSCSA